MGPTRILLSSAQAWPRETSIRSAARIACIALMSIDLARLLRQHDRNAVADRISKLRRARDQLLAGRIELQRPLGQRTDQDFQQFRIDGVFGAFRQGVHLLVSGSCVMRPLSIFAAPLAIIRWRAAPFPRSSLRTVPLPLACPTERSRGTPNRGFARAFAPGRP